ncbi:hypothetical protein PQ610_04905 [Tardisphaera miroshnichenkoae]
MRKSNFDYLFVYLTAVTGLILFQFVTELKRIHSFKSALLALAFIIFSALALGLFFITFGFSLLFGLLSLFPSGFLVNVLLLVISLYGVYSRSLE